MSPRMVTLLLCVAVAVLSTADADASRHPYNHHRPISQHYPHQHDPRSGRFPSLGPNSPEPQTTSVQRTDTQQNHAQTRQSVNPIRTMLHGRQNTHSPRRFLQPNPQARTNINPVKTAAPPNPALQRQKINPPRTVLQPNQVSDRQNTYAARTAPQPNQGQRRLKVNSGRPQNSQYMQPNNRLMVQPRPHHPFFRQGINPLDGQNLLLPHYSNRQRNSPAPHPRNGASRLRSSYLESPWWRNRHHSTIRSQTSGLRSSTGRKIPTRTGGLANAMAASRIAGTSSRVGKQWTLSRKLVANSPAISWQSRSHSRNTGRSTAQSSCPDGKVLLRGECRCPYLSNWDAQQGKCVCIYGTYRDARGDCRNY